jgi:hypothetical protein
VTIAKLRRWAFAVLPSLLAASIVAASACADQAATPAGARRAPWILAEPNPVPAGAGPGSTVLSWNSGALPGEVYVAIDGQPEILFAGASHQGSQAARWIDNGTYEFRLYAVDDRTRPRARVTVGREQPSWIDRVAGLAIGLGLFLISMLLPRRR